MNDNLSSVLQVDSTLLAHSLRGHANRSREHNMAMHAFVCESSHAHYLLPTVWPCELLKAVFTIMRFA
jgi:hypothetical protein